MKIRDGLEEALNFAKWNMSTQSLSPGFLSGWRWELALSRNRCTESNLSSISVFRLRATTLFQNKPSHNFNIVKKQGKEGVLLLLPMIQCHRRDNMQKRSLLWETYLLNKTDVLMWDLSVPSRAKQTQTKVIIKVDGLEVCYLHGIQKNSFDFVVGIHSSLIRLVSLVSTCSQWSHTGGFRARGRLAIGKTSSLPHMFLFLSSLDNQDHKQEGVILHW